MSTCTICGHGLADDRARWTTCQACQDRITQQLADIEQMWPLLSDCLEPTRGHSGPRVSGSKQHGTLPAEHVLELIGPAGIPARLYWQYASICVARGLQPQQAAPGSEGRLVQALRGLRRHLPWAVQAVDLTEAQQEIRRMADQMARVTGGTPQAPTVPCPGPADGDPCDGQLRFDRDQNTAWCRTCRTELEPGEWMAYALKTGHLTA